MAEIDYEKILKEALNNKSLPFEVASWIEEQFPQLAESEDESIRKEILDYIIKGSESYYDVQQYGREKFEKWIAWLEKPCDKVSAIEGFETEFERQVSHLIASAINREHEYNEGYVKWTANALLNFAKHELEKQGGQKSTNNQFTLEQAGVLDKHIDKFLEQKHDGHGD